MNAPTRVPDMRPGDTAWLKVISASKIAAVVGLSPYESRYSLWHLMAGHVAPQPSSAILDRGHYLEPAIAAWFADQIGEDDRLPADVHIAPAGTYAAHGQPEHVASPDRLLKEFTSHKDGARQWSTTDSVGLLEIKSALNDWEWGATGTDTIPAGYRCQVQWQLYVMGLPVAYVAAITSHLEFRWYRIERDQDDIDYLIEQADAFLASIAAGTEPDVDASEHTYAALRELHPEIDGTTVQLEAITAAEWVAALEAEKNAKARRQAVQNRIAQLMGTAQYAECNHTTYARRQARKGTRPFVVAPNGLIAKEMNAA